MRSVRVDGEDLNCYFVDKDNNVYRMISYNAAPQASFFVIDVGSPPQPIERQTLTIGSALYDKLELRKLVKEDLT